MADKPLRYPKPEERFSSEELKSYLAAKNKRKRKKRTKARIEKLRAEIADMDEKIAEDSVIDAEVVETHEMSKELVVIQTVDPRESDSASHLEAEAENIAPNHVETQSDSVQSSRPRIRCTARNSEGEQCGLWANYGSNVCRTHGGNAPQVREKARVRAAYVADKAMQKLIDFAFDDSKPAKVQLDSIKHVLVQGGITPPTQVEVGPIKPYEEVFDSIVYSAPIDSQGSASLAQQGEPTTDHPQPADANQHDTDSAAGYDDFPSYDPPEREQPPRRQSRRERSQNRYEELSDEDAMRLVYEENARNAADPPPPRPMRALPRGRY